MRSFTDIFIERPVMAAVLSLLFLLLGGMAFTLLGVRETPEVQQPVVTVTTFWPGADPAIVESDVTEVLERQLNGIEGVRTISSTSQEQSSQITVEFELERELEDAANDVRSRVARARKDLPDDAEEPVVEKADANAQPVMFIRLAADNADLLTISEVADTLVRERVENVPGVSGVDLFGAQIYAMRVELDAAKMAARGLVLSDVEAALRASNVDLPAGRVEGAATQLSIQFSGGLRSVEDFEELVVRNDPSRLVRLRDIATVRLGAANERTAARADGVPSLSLAITPQAQANIIDVSDEVRRRLPDIRADLPAGMQLDLVYDRADAVRSSIHDVELTLGIAFVLVVGVIFAFLRDWRSTIVPTLAIPVSLVGTFLFLWAFGFTINVFTLFGLVLAIGLVVDDAIVVLENIVRRVEEGETVRDAALHGTRQIAFAVIATTLSLVAVFLPVIFTGGTTGRLFLEFGVTVAVAVSISMLVALTLTPMLCDQLLRPAGRPNLLQRAGEAVLDWMNRAFAGSLRFTLRWPLLVLPVVLLSLGAGAFGWSTLPREFFPIEDRNIFFIRLQATEGTSFAWTDARMREIETELMERVPERKMMLSRVAMGPGGVAASTNSGMLVFPLQPARERERSQQQIVAALKGPLSEVTAFRTIPIQFPTVGRGFSSPMQFVIQNPEFSEIARVLPGFVQKIREIPGLSAVNEDLKLDRPELAARIDRVKAAELGISAREIARSLQVLSAGVELSTFKRGVRQYEVVVGLGPQDRDEPADLAGLHLRARDGRMVPLSTLVRFEEQSGAASRFHYNRSPSATISANLDGITLGEAISRVRAVAAQELPAGFRTALAGDSKEFVESTSSLGLLFGLALALVYLLLAAQFDSFVAPISVLLTVPLALVGAFAALAGLGQSLSFFAQVGLILLVGLVTKNGILIVEYARQLQAEGHDPWSAAEAAARLRFRPILMTSVATIGGAVPIAVGFSGSSRVPLGIAVVGGMLSATFLTLYVTPVVYAALAGLRGRRVLAAAAILGFAGRAEAAPMSLREVLAVAMEHSYDLRAARQDVVGAESTLTQARADLLPSASASASAAVSDDLGTLGEPWLGASAAARIDVPLLALQTLHGVEAYRLDAAATSASYLATEEAVLEEVAGRFINLQRARSSVRDAEAQLGSAQRLEKLAADRVEVGAAPGIDLTRARLSTRRAEAAVLRARTGEESARMSLAESMGIELDAALELAEASPLVTPASLPGEADVVAARDAHPEIEALRRYVGAYEARLRAATSAGAPTLSAYGQVGATLANSGNSAPVSAGLSASMPLFSGGSIRAGIEGARADLTSVRTSLTAKEREVEAALKIALRSLRDAGQGLVVADAAWALATEEMERAEERYRAGQASNLEVTQAQADLAAAAAAKVDAMGSYNEAVVGWYVAKGRLHELAPG